VGEVLTLRTTAGRLWRLVRKAVAECLAELPGAPHECRLGGGTTLAARFHHRDSFDIDLTTGPGTNLGYLRPRFEEALTKLGGRPRYRDDHLKIDFDTGLLDVSKLQRDWSTATVLPPQEVMIRGDAHERQQRDRRDEDRAWRRRRPPPGEERSPRRRSGAPRGRP